MFHFVDQILSLDPGRHAVGVKHVTEADVFLRRRAGAGPILRPCIVGEALGQLGAWVVMQANGFTLRPVAGIARDVRLLGTAAPGDEIRLDTTIDAMNDGTVAYHAVATVRGSEVVVLEEGLGPLLPLEDFDDPQELRGRLARIRAGSAGAPAAAVARAADGPGSCFELDEVRVAAGGAEATAQKCIAPDWPFFADHFPRKPVFPLTLLLEGLFGLGERLLAAAGAAADGPLLPVCVRRVKMNRFVEPGSVVQVRAEVRERDARQARLVFRCVVDGERVCLAEADYARTEGRT